METQKFDFIKEKHAELSVSAVMVCKQFLAYTVHINGSACFLTQSITFMQVSIYSSVNFMHIYVPTNLHK